MNPGRTVNAVSTLEAVVLAALVLVLQAGIMLRSVARPLGSALHEVDVVVHQRAERAQAMPPFSEFIEVRGTRLAHGS